MMFHSLGLALLAAAVAVSDSSVQSAALEKAIESLIAVNSSRPGRIYVEGGPKELKNAVLTLLRQESVLTPVPYRQQPEANIKVLKNGGAEVKCGKHKAVLPGPSADQIVQQFKRWLPKPLRDRRLERLDPQAVLAMAALQAGDYAGVAQLLERSRRQTQPAPQAKPQPSQRFLGPSTSRTGSTRCLLAEWTETFTAWTK
jgi:hypothetical protein